VLTRLCRLEGDRTDGDLGLSVDDIEREAGRWDALLEPVVKGVAREPCLLLRDDAERMFLTLWSLLDTADSDRPQFTPEGAMARLTVCRRWPGAVAGFIAKVPGKMRDEVLASGLARGDDREPWLPRWFSDLAELCCRTPPDVSPTALATVLDVQMHPPAGCYCSLFSVCPTCGLRLPAMLFSTALNKYRSLMEFDVSPCCGVSHTEWWPLGRIAERRFDWVSLAESELSFSD
jgi:hypothetical protein